MTSGTTGRTWDAYIDRTPTWQKGWRRDLCPHWGWWREVIPLRRRKRGGEYADLSYYESQQLCFLTVNIMTRDEVIAFVLQLTLGQ